MTFLYDIQTKENALKTLGRFFVTPSRKIDDRTIKSDISLEEIEFKCRHITTSLSNARCIKKNGLMSTLSVLKDHSSDISVFLRCCNVELSQDGIFCHADSHEPYLYSFQSEPLKSVFKDNCVSAYLYCGNLTEEYDVRPEILKKIQDGLCDVKMDEAIKFWKGNATAFCIEYLIPFCDVDVITGIYSAKESESESYPSILSSLIELASTIAHSLNGCPTNIPIISKTGLKIPPEKLAISALMDLEWDFK